jgi:hypothetical protein
LTLLKGTGVRKAYFFGMESKGSARDAGWRSSGVVAKHLSWVL